VDVGDKASSAGRGSSYRREEIPDAATMVMEFVDPKEYLGAGKLEKLLGVEAGT